jgi:hypothetical protein
MCYIQCVCGHPIPGNLKGSVWRMILDQQGRQWELSQVMNQCYLFDPQYKYLVSYWKLPSSLRKQLIRTDCSKEKVTLEVLIIIVSFIMSSFWKSNMSTVPSTETSPSITSCFKYPHLWESGNWLVQLTMHQLTFHFWYRSIRSRIVSLFFHNLTTLQAKSLLINDLFTGMKAVLNGWMQHPVRTRDERCYDSYDCST